jgi:DNA processing protein
MSEAPHYLIQNGAKMATSTRDILDELDMQLKTDYEEVEKIIPGSKEESVILGFLENEPLHLDELVRISGLTASIVSSKLTVMEIKGIVRNVGGGIYKKV